jgi:heat shock protein HtpX
VQRSYGRDFWLSLRMVVALALVALIYLAAEAIAVALTIAAALDRNVVATLGGLLFAAGIVAGLIAQIRKPEALILRAARAKVLEAEQEAELQGLVARVAAQADLPQPRVALIHSWAPNALTAARKPETAVVAVTTELLRRLEPNELEAVVAHELAHVANRDGPVMTFVSGPAMAMSAFWHMDDSRGKISYILLFWITVPLHVISLLLMWTVSRYREYAADRGSAMITGAPQDLISALLEIEGGAPPRSDLRGGLAVNAFCIVSRRSRWRRVELVMDHPPVRKRIDRLEELARELGKAEA